MQRDPPFSERGTCTALEAGWVDGANVHFDVIDPSTSQRLQFVGYIQPNQPVLSVAMQANDKSSVVHWVRCPEPSTWCSDVASEGLGDHCKFDTSVFEAFFRKRVNITMPGLVINYRLDIEELPIKEICEATGLRLFFVKFFSADGGSWFNSGLFVMNDWQLMDVGPSATVKPLSGMVVGDAAYLSYGWGSGIYRSVLARLRVVDGEIQNLSTGGFFSRDLFVRAADDRVGVFSGWHGPTFNTWTNEMLLGFLRASRGGKLEVVDGNGQTITADY